MAKLFIEDTSLIAIGDAIREKTGGTATMSPAEMVTAIENIVATGGETVIGDVGMVGLTYKTTSNLVNTYDVSAYNTKHCFVITRTDYSGGSRYITEVEDGVTKQYYSIGGTDGRLYEYNGSNTSTASPKHCPAVTIDEAGIMTVTSQSYKLGYYAILFYSTGSGEAGGGITPEGELEITENGSYDVTNYASAAVNVPVGVFPEGTQHITENGTYNIAEYENVLVEVASSGGGDSEDSDLLMWLVENDGYTDAKKEGFYNDKFTRIGDYAFYFKPIAGTIELPNVTLIGSYSFASMTMYKFTKFIAPKLTSIGAYAFNPDSYLESIEAENVEEIYSNAFQGCTALKEVKFPKITSIGSNAFRSCSALTKVDLGSNMTASILTRTFNACSNLTALILRNTDTIVGLGANNAFDSTPIASGTGYIYVPRTLINTYKTANNWSNYATQFRAIEDYPEICG